MPIGLNERTRGWLRFLWDKTTTPDDWSSRGTPHAWWDRQSSAPMCSFPRFDLTESACILPVLADQTPAWREVYTRMADEIVGRHTTFWAAIDWITLIGHDPDPDRYPPEWLAFLPGHLQGRYDPPGWTANGVEPWGLQPDPIGSDGNLFFRGFFTLILSIYRYVSGDDKWERPFEMTGYRDRKFEWTHHRIAEFLHLQWKDRPQGPHCENTKIWPNCLSGAGLGLQLTDATTGTRFHGVYDEWIAFARKHYLRTDAAGRLVSFPLYYDPIEEVVCTFPNEASGLAALVITPYVLPQNREFGEYLYREAARIVGWSRTDVPLRMKLEDPRLQAIGLLMARELGDVSTERRLREVIERDYEPRWFGDEGTRFGWWFGTGESHPRGQLSGLLALSDAGEPGAWVRAFNPKDPRTRFAEPTVEGVDYPVLGVAEAWNDLSDGVLHVSTYAATPSRRGTPTRFRVTKLGDPHAVVVRVDGEDARWRVVGDEAVEIETDVGEHAFRIVTRGRRAAKESSGSGRATGSETEEPGAALRDDGPTAYVPVTPRGCGSSCC